MNLDKFNNWCEKHPKTILAVIAVLACVEMMIYE